MFFHISSTLFGDDYFDIVWGAALRDPTKTDSTKINFLIASNQGTSLFFKISAHIQETNVLTSFGNTPGTPPKWTLQLLISCLAQTRVPVLFFDIKRYNRQIFRSCLRVPPYRRPPQDGPPKIKFLHDQTYDACVCDISRYFRGKHFDRVWGYHLFPPLRTSQTVKSVKCIQNPNPSTRNIKKTI